MSDPCFITEANAQAESLITLFPISRIEALTIVIIKSLCEHNSIITKKKVRDIITKYFNTNTNLSEVDLKSVNKMYDTLSEGKLRPDKFSISWIDYLWKRTALSNALLEETELEEGYKDAAEFYEIDSRIVNLIKHAIAAKSPIYLRIKEFFQDMSLEIVKHLLEKEGIYCLIGSEVDGEESLVYAMQALQAIHLEGIVLFQESNPLKIKAFTAIAQVFGFRFGILDKASNDIIEADEESSDDSVAHIEYIPAVNVTPQHISGEKLRKRASEYFSDDPEFIRLLIGSKANAAALCYSKALIKEIISKKDWSSLSRLFGDAQKADISEDPKKRQQVNSTHYDIRAINPDIPIDILDRMAEKAFGQHSPWKLMLYGGSGTGKSAYAYHLAEKLGIEVIVKRPQDLIHRYFGESETAIATAFREAEAKNALLLFDEADSYLSRKTEVYSGSDKAHNDITTSFMVNLEEYNEFVIATTNHVELIEPALIRRFHKIAEFRYPTRDGMKHLFRRYFPDVIFDRGNIEKVCSLGTIGAGDFAVVKELAEYMEPEDVTGDFIIDSLISNSEARKKSSCW